MSQDSQSLARYAAPRNDKALFHFLAHEIEPLERRLVRHHEKVGVAAARLVAREGPMRDGEDVVLRPFEGPVTDGS